MPTSLRICMVMNEITSHVSIAFAMLDISSRPTSSTPPSHTSLMMTWTWTLTWASLSARSSSMRCRTSWTTLTTITHSSFAWIAWFETAASWQEWRFTYWYADMLLEGLLLVYWFLFIVFMSEISMESFHVKSTRKGSRAWICLESGGGVSSCGTNGTWLIRHVQAWIQQKWKVCHDHSKIFLNLFEMFQFLNVALDSMLLRVASNSRIGDASQMNCR